MICAECLTELSPPSTDAPCPSCGADPRLAGRYALRARVGRGARGVVYRATDLRSGDTVAVKQVLVGHLDSDKARELVAREGAVLRQLRHPALPRWRDELLVGRGRAAAACLVQDFVEGKDLQAELPEHRWSEAEALDLLDELLDVLAYLHGLHPPVVHRDLKPANLLRRPDGRLALVDFGAVREALSDAAGGSTVAGTFGFMAPEAFGGAAPPASDVYALGMTVVALLSRRPPAELHGRDGQVAWRSALRVGPGLMGLLDALLQPDPDRRPTAAEARRRVAALRAAGPGPSAPAGASPARPLLDATPVFADPRPPPVDPLAPPPPPELPARAGPAAAPVGAAHAPGGRSATTTAARAIAVMIFVSAVVYLILAPAGLRSAWQALHPVGPAPVEAPAERPAPAPAPVQVTHPDSPDRPSVCWDGADAGLRRVEGAPALEGPPPLPGGPSPVGGQPDGTACEAIVYFGPGGAAEEALVSGPSCPRDVREAVCRDLLPLEAPPAPGEAVRVGRYRFEAGLRR